MTTNAFPIAARVAESCDYYAPEVATARLERDLIAYVHAATEGSVESSP